ncbi:translation initiation factor IF-3 [Flaviaesturariibacter flavus]|uniref:Translation initiation factor IF-3 n=1 Tax=Flaviaesturariibacter flavus TaxID=2502780 RepID=A0A4R1BNE6_9BACT|nr:translation initiation factor IF-3 [Flaviaesturariibacter flavus]TCJ19054.1 translation initiation factor IF-3 [Flaviaesturariibacter flavus]
MALPSKSGGGFRPGGGFRGRFIPRKEAEHRINHHIRVPQVRLVGDNVTIGVYTTQEALKMAQDQALDLVEISPQADPPVCRIIDYNKFLYDKKKKEKEMKAKAKTTEMKEIRFTPNTDDHDFDFKSKHAESFLKEGNKVKAYVQFKGRAIQFKDRGELLLLKFAERLAEVGQLESMPKLEGKRMLAIISPKTSKKPKGEGKGPKEPREPREPRPPKPEGGQAEGSQPEAPAEQQ